MISDNFRCKNHYVPQLYLKRWALDGLRVPTYRLLVPHQNYPLWKPESLNSIPSHRHLYTRLSAGTELDDLEKWFDWEFESPAEKVFQKIDRDDRLTPDDWRVLIRFLALQDVRTPARMQKMLKRMETTLPELMKVTLDEAVAKAQAAADAGQILETTKTRDEPLFPISVRSELEPNAEFGRLTVETVVGRGLWLEMIQHLLNNTINALMLHRWTIIKPPTGVQWPTSDNPVIRLNYNSPTRYDFEGGWGSKGTEILLPLSPQHLLYTRIGERPPQRGSVTPLPFADLICRFIVENAHRYVFSLTENDFLPNIRNRHTDAEAFLREKNEWEKFHDQNVLAENALSSQ